MKAIKYILGMVLLMTTVSCEKFVEIDAPITELEQSSVFVSDKTANAAMVGIYSDMNAYNYTFANLITMFMGPISSDDFLYESTVAAFLEFKTNIVSEGNTYVGLVWSQPYNYIYRCNAIIEGVTASTTMTAAMKTKLLGEAKFLRAFCNFYLVNLFGDVPLVLNTDVLVNTTLPRTPAAEVYQSIIADLKEAKSMLSATYPTGGARTRPSKGAATLMLARAYLYSGNNAQAEIEAGELIANTTYSLLPGANMNKTFLIASTETVWQLESVNLSLGKNTWEGYNMTPPNVAAPVTNYRLTKDAKYGLVPAFETGDLRKANWTGSWTTTAGVTNTYPYKYKVRANVAAVTEYSMVLRFAEAYLIRGEARIQQNKLQSGKEDLDVIRLRAGLPVLTVPTSIAQGMLMVEKERRAEFFAEWGHRWFDLKRWKSVSGDLTKTRADDILPLTKPTWKSTAILMPIPTEATRSNPTLTQNPGY